MKFLLEDSDDDDFGDWDWEDEIGDFIKCYNVLRLEVNVVNIFGKC